MGYQKVKYRRRREGKTDYKARLALLKSNLPRVVVRKTNRYIIMQLVASREAQDSVLLCVNSRELLDYGWPSKFAGSLRSVPAAYLTGFLFGTKIKKIKLGKETKEIKKAVPDLGLSRSTKGARIYAALKGLIDAGLNVACSEKMFPDEKRLYARHMKKEISMQDIKKKIQENGK